MRYAAHKARLQVEPRSTYFFATRADLEPGLLAAEHQRPLQYVLRGLFPTPAVAPVTTALEIPDLGRSPTGDWISPDYLVLDADNKLEIRSVPQRRGGILYAVDEVANPCAVILRPGGLYGSECLIAGSIEAVGDLHSLELYRVFRRTVVKGFKRIQEFFVGPEAARLRDAGMRLTQRVQAPAECDLERQAGAT
jgi:hypothetical protein